MAQNTALPTFSTLYAFGDSLSDAGNLSITTRVVGPLTPVSPPYYQEKYGLLSGNVFSNGPTWVQDLSTALGFGTLAPSLTGGTDFAYGGAETGPTPQNASDQVILAISLPAQLVAFQTAISQPSADALYTISIGANDLLDILSETGLSAQQQAADVNAAVANEIGFISKLIGAGAKNLLVLDVPDLGKTPDVTSGSVNGSNVPSAALDAEASQLASQYNSQLAAQLAGIPAAGGLNVSIVDAYQLIDSAVANPASYGLTNVTTPVWSGTYSDAGSGTLATTDVAAQNQYLFWDKLHPTETGHQAITTLAEDQLIAKSGALLVQDTTTGQPLPPTAQPYSGPVAGLQEQYINITPNNLNIATTTPNWFLHSGSGTDAIDVSRGGGTNVLDGSTGSNFLMGGSGNDSFFLDDRSPAADVFSTVAGFHSGDDATVFGVNPSDFIMKILDNQGAAGFTGLDFAFSAPGHANANIVLAGYSAADLGNGRLTTSYGTTSDTPGLPGSQYFMIHAT
jgi:phospholipase/lecithinase/hemolysin